MHAKHGPRKTIGYCLENNRLYCSPNPRWRRYFFSQSGAKLKIQDGSANESEAMLEKSPLASTEDWDWPHRFP